MLNEWLFVEEEDGKGILNDNIALSLERQCKEEEDGKGILNIVYNSVDKNLWIV